METFMHKERTWKPGHYAKPRFYDRRAKEKRPGCKWQAQIECKDYDKKLLAQGTRKVVTQKVNFYGPDYDTVYARVEAFIAELKERFPEGVAAAEGRSRTVAEIIDTYFTEDIEPRLPHRTVRSYASLGNHIKAKLGPEAEDELKSSIIKAALWEPHRKLAKEAINYLKRALNHANTDTKDYVNPCANVTPVFQRGYKPNPKHKRERGLITPAQMTALFKAVGASTQWYAFFFLMAFTGARVSELLLANIGEYDPKEHTLYIPPEHTKTKAGNRYIVLGPKGIELLEKQIDALRAKGHTGGALFPALMGNPYSPTNFYREVFDPAMLAAKLAVEVKEGEPWRYDDTKTRKVDGIDPVFTTHWFRHTAKTREELGVTVEGRDDLPKGQTPTTLRDLQLGHENARSRFDEASVTLPYSHADNPIGFPMRRPYADRADAVIASYLPGPYAVPDSSAEAA